jgi:hypothetical protein
MPNSLNYLNYKQNPQQIGREIHAAARESWDSTSQLTRSILLAFTRNNLGAVCLLADDVQNHDEIIRSKRLCLCVAESYLENKEYKKALPYARQSLEFFEIEGLGVPPKVLLIVCKIGYELIKSETNLEGVRETVDFMRSIRENSFLKVYTKQISTMNTEAEVSVRLLFEQLDPAIVLEICNKLLQKHAGHATISDIALFINNFLLYHIETSPAWKSIMENQPHYIARINAEAQGEMLLIDQLKEIASQLDTFGVGGLARKMEYPEIRSQLQNSTSHREKQPNVSQSLQFLQKSFASMNREPSKDVVHQINSTIRLLEEHGVVDQNSREYVHLCYYIGVYELYITQNREKAKQKLKEGLKAAQNIEKTLLEQTSEHDELGEQIALMRGDIQLTASLIARAYPEENDVEIDEMK